MKNECVCNKCEEQFAPEFKHRIIGHDKNGGEVMHTYFDCPNCKARYTALITDSIYKEMQDEYRKRSRSIALAAKNNANQGKLKALLNQLNHYESNTMKPYYAQMKEYWMKRIKEGDIIAEQI